MSNTYFMTPEEHLRKKKRNKYILYVTVFLLTAIISAGVTILANRI